MGNSRTDLARTPGILFLPAQFRRFIMYAIVLSIHNLLRWVVLLTGV